MVHLMVVYPDELSRYRDAWKASNKEVIRLLLKDVNKLFADIVVRDLDGLFREEAKQMIYDLYGGKWKGKYQIKFPSESLCSIFELSEECEAALVLLYYYHSRADQMIYFIDTDFYDISENIWAWFSSHTELKIYINAECFCEAYPPYCFDQVKEPFVEVNGKLCSKDETEDFLYDCRWFGSEISYRTEAFAYELYRGRREEAIMCRPEEEDSLAGFAGRLSDSVYEASEEWINENEDYQVVNGCTSVLREESDAKYPPIYVWIRCEGCLKMERTLAVKYPSVLDILEEIMEFSLSSDDGKAFAIILEHEEYDGVWNYTKNVWFGVKIDSSRKYIYTYEKDNAIEMFHSIFLRQERESGKEEIGKKEICSGGIPGGE